MWPWSSRGLCPRDPCNGSRTESPICLHLGHIEGKAHVTQALLGFTSKPRSLAGVRMNDQDTYGHMTIEDMLCVCRARALRASGQKGQNFFFIFEKKITIMSRGPWPHVPLCGSTELQLANSSNLAIANTKI